MTRLPGRQGLRTRSAAATNAARTPPRPRRARPASSMTPPTDKRGRRHVASPAEGPGASGSEEASRRPEQVDVNRQSCEHAREKQDPAPGVLGKPRDKIDQPGGSRAERRRLPALRRQPAVRLPLGRSFCLAAVTEALGCLLGRGLRSPSGPGRGGALVRRGTCPSRIGIGWR